MKAQLFDMLELLRLRKQPAHAEGHHAAQCVADSCYEERDPQRFRIGFEYGEQRGFRATGEQRGGEETADEEGEKAGGVGHIDEYGSGL